MAKGSESASWKWAGSTRHCDTCGNELRISDVALFYGLKERGIRCFGCVDEKMAQRVSEMRAMLGLTGVAA